MLLAAPGRAAAFSLPAWANGDGPIDELEATRTLLRTWPGSGGVPTHTPPRTQRALAVKNDERCKASCDEGRDFECDHDWSDDMVEYVGSCDTHPTTSCDLACGPGLRATVTLDGAKLTRCAARPRHSHHKRERY